MQIRLSIPGFSGPLARFCAYFSNAAMRAVITAKALLKSSFCYRKSREKGGYGYLGRVLATTTMSRGLRSGKIVPPSA